jgi:hypothetical protein
MSDTDTGWDKDVAQESVGGGMLGSRSSRPGPDTVERRMAELPVIEQAEMNKAGAEAAKLSPGVLETFYDIKKSMQRGAIISGQAAAERERLVGDDSNRVGGVLNDAVRARIEQLQQKAPADVKSAFDAAADGIEILQASLVAGSMPRIEGTQRAEAVEEVRMLVDGLTGGELVSALQRIAGGPNRRHAAVVLSSWGSAKLGGDAQLHGALQLLGLEGAKKYGTPSERSHALAFESLPLALKKAVGTARFQASHRLGR